MVTNLRNMLRSSIRRKPYSDRMVTDVIRARLLLAGIDQASLKTLLPRSHPLKARLLTYFKRNR